MLLRRRLVGVVDLSVRRLLVRETALCSGWNWSHQLKAFMTRTRLSLTPSVRRLSIREMALVLWVGLVPSAENLHDYNWTHPEQEAALPVDRCSHVRPPPTLPVAKLYK